MYPDIRLGELEIRELGHVTTGLFIRYVLSWRHSHGSTSQVCLFLFLPPSLSSENMRAFGPAPVCPVNVQ